MKSTTSAPAANDLPYPKLMIGYQSGVIIMFFREKVGAVVHPGNSGMGIGEFTDNWSMFNFGNYTGSVTISQE